MKPSLGRPRCGVVPCRCLSKAICDHSSPDAPGAAAGAGQGRNSRGIRVGKRELGGGAGAVSTSRAVGAGKRGEGQGWRPSVCSWGQAGGNPGCSRELVAPGLGDRSAGSPGGTELCRDTAGSRRWRSPRLIIQPLGRLGNAAAARRRGGGGDRDICPLASQGSGTATAPLLLLLLQPLAVGMQVLIPMVPWGPQRAGDARCRSGG